VAELNRAHGLLQAWLSHRSVIVLQGSASGWRVGDPVRERRAMPLA
jgi:hypothetical protein